MVYNKADLKKHIETLQIEGFKIKSAVQVFLLLRKRNNKTEAITISYRDYAPHGFYLYSPSASISYDEVENMINPLLSKYQIVNKYGDVTIQKGFVGLIEGVDFSKFDLEIKDQDSFSVIADEIKKIIDKGILPFFEKFNSLHAVNEEINRLNEEELSNFISGIVGIKVPLIKKLAGAGDFIRELKERNQFYSDEVFKYPQYFKDHDKVFKDLFAEDLKTV